MEGTYTLLLVDYPSLLKMVQGTSNHKK